MKSLLRTESRDVATAPPAVSLMDDETYRAAAEKYEEIKGRLASLDARRQELQSGLARMAEADMLDDRARTLLDDDVVPRAVDDTKLRRDLEAVTDEIRVVRRAVELQRETVAREGDRVSREICARLAPAHRALVQQIGKHLTGLVDALRAEHEFREALIVGGVSFASTLRAMPLPHVWRPDEEGDAARWLKDAREHGLWP